MLKDDLPPSMVVTSQNIAQLAARAALETRGVIRLEPSIKDTLSTLHPSVLKQSAGTSDEAGGSRHHRVWVCLNDGTARVHLEITTDHTHRALVVSSAVRDRVRQSINLTGLTAGAIDISVLAIE